MTLDDIQTELGSPGAEMTYKDSMAEIKGERMLRALEEVAGNKAEAARSLGLSRTTFINKLKKHGLL